MIILALTAFIILCFGLVVFSGAPYLPSLKKQKSAALDLLSLEPGQTLVELGSGDGRVLNAAAERGLYAVGYELNPLLVFVSWFATYKHRDKIKVVWGDYWSKDLKKADGIYVFLYSSYMRRLDRKISGMDKEMKLASVTFKVPDKKPLKEKAGVFLYQY